MDFFRNIFRPKKRTPYFDSREIDKIVDMRNNPDRYSQERLNKRQEDKINEVFARIHELIMSLTQAQYLSFESAVSVPVVEQNGSRPQKAAWKLHTKSNEDGTEFRSWWLVSDRQLAVQYLPATDNEIKPLWVSNGRLVEAMSYGVDELLAVEKELRKRVS